MCVRWLVILFLLLSPLNAEEFTARITYYHGKKTASGLVPIQGVTIAAERKYRFGTKVHIPELVPLVGGSGWFVVQDRGPAVQSRRASNGKTPVIDVYVNSRALVNKLAKQKKNTFKVTIQ